MLRVRVGGPGRRTATARPSQTPRAERDPAVARGDARLTAASALAGGAASVRRVDEHDIDGDLGALGHAADVDGDREAALLDLAAAEARGLAAQDLAALLTVATTARTGALPRLVTRPVTVSVLPLHFALTEPSATVPVLRIVTLPVRITRPFFARSV